MKKIIKCANNSIFMYYINKTTQFRFMLKCHKNMPSLIKKLWRVDIIGKNLQ